MIKRVLFLIVCLISVFICTELIQIPDQCKYQPIVRASPIPIYSHLYHKWSLSEGLAVVRIDGKYGYIDKTGKIIIKPQFDFAHDFCNKHKVNANCLFHESLYIKHRPSEERRDCALSTTWTIVSRICDESQSDSRLSGFCREDDEDHDTREAISVRNRRIHRRELS